VGKCNQAVAPGITRPICMPLVVATTYLIFWKIFELLSLTNFTLKSIWCASEISYGEF